MKNIGNRDGDETAEIYLLPKGDLEAPLRTLVGFQRVHLRKGETEISRSLCLHASSAWSHLMEAGVCNPATNELYLGGGQPSRDNTGVFLPIRIEGSFTLEP